MTNASAARRNADALLDPVGTWSCVLYGNPALGDERVLLRFEPDGDAGLARPSEHGTRPWAPLSRWTTTRSSLTFSDSRTGRQFDGDLTRSTLGGTWRTLSLVGGWWCTAVDDETVGETSGLTVPERAARMPPLIPDRVATPTYPLKAIREAKEGRAVTCFFVDATGSITNPEIIELSDEIFRAPSLSALERSRYRGWKDEQVVRPACRSFIFRLDTIYSPEPANP